MKNKFIFIPLGILICILFISFGFASFSSKLTITGITASVRPQANIRVTSFYAKEGENDGQSQWDEYSSARIATAIKLPKANSSVTYRVEITNLGSVEMGILSIDNMPSELDYELIDYKLKDKLCSSDQADNCKLGATALFDIKIKYKDNKMPASVPTESIYTANLDIVFKQAYNITYTGIDQLDSYPTTILADDNLSIDLAENAPDSVLVKMNNEKISSYTYSNGIIGLSNATGDVEIIKNIVSNTPNLVNEMIPIKYNTSSGNWVICSTSDPDWYDYNSKKWANVMLGDGKYTSATAKEGTEVLENELGSMFVWIPRFAYKITEGYHGNPGAIDVVLLDGTSTSFTNSSGIIEQAKNGNAAGVTSENSYVVHPAFTNGASNGYSNGEWKSEISGFWISKFEAGFHTKEYDTTKKISSSDASNGLYYPIFKGRKLAYNYISFTEAYYLGLALDNANNPYGINESYNSHLAKNSEWGAVSYLSVSKYGYSGGTSGSALSSNASCLKAVGNDSLGTLIYNPNYPNNTSRRIGNITGYSASTRYVQNNVLTGTTIDDVITDVVEGSGVTSYAWNYTNSNSAIGPGTRASTTNNVYGVYDMSGGGEDFVAVYLYNASSLSTLQSTFPAGNGVSNHLMTAIKSTSTSAYVDFNTSYQDFSKIFGDGIWETSTDSYVTWFGSGLENDTMTAHELKIGRGGRCYHRDNAFFRVLDLGDSATGHDYGSFHVVLIKE